jgi:class 3 adenylate cyclase
MVAPLPKDEAERLQELEQLDVLDTAEEQEYDDLTHLASQICGTPIALMTLLDEKRQWWKSRVGMPGTQTSRDIAFCAHAILNSDVMVVRDARSDQRFADNPLVTNDPSIRFYAGAPMVTLNGHAVGTLCVIDRVPRELTDSQKKSLEALSRQAVMLLELRRAKRQAEQAHAQKKTLLDQLTIEQDKSDRLLASLFPPPVAKRLRDDPSAAIADEYASATVMFADLTNFWLIAARRSPRDVIDLLNRAFSLFDSLVSQHGVDKVKTIGETYIAVSGVEGTRRDHAVAMAELAMAMMREVCAIDTGTRETLELRIGIHCGPLVAGVVGTRKLAYDVWGPTVALANQMETCGVPGGIQVSASVYQLLDREYLFEPRGEFYVPQEGEVTTYLLTGRAQKPGRV